MAINLAQFQALAMRTFSLAKLVAERDRQVRRELEDGWERLVSEGAGAAAVAWRATAGTQTDADIRAAMVLVLPLTITNKPSKQNTDSRYRETTNSG